MYLIRTSPLSRGKVGWVYAARSEKLKTFSDIHQATICLGNSAFMKFYITMATNFFLNWNVAAFNEYKLILFSNFHTLR